jgi:hypothetical protein
LIDKEQQLLRVLQLVDYDGSPGKIKFLDSAEAGQPEVSTSSHCVNCFANRCTEHGDRVEQMLTCYLMKEKT